ncbi:S16 family serine protease [Planococcus salinus]|uniref:S16 family serine protease n=1 Tax=Planococcus salinus TaxID=1848460 RepID=UPI001314F3A1|nr:S16 family serine protease [Planococcus salinus]
MRKGMIAGSLLVLGGALGLFLLYLFDWVNSFVYIGGLFMWLLVLFVMLLVVRHHKRTALFVGAVVAVLTLLLLFDIRLLNYELATHAVTSYKEPIPATADSNVHLMIVNTTTTAYYGEDDGFIEEGENVLAVYPITNSQRYHQKNEDLRAFVEDKTDYFGQMRENVEAYLGFPPGDVVAAYNRTDIEGNSLGLGIALAASLHVRDVANEIPIAVTGAIHPDGSIHEIGVVTEKTLIAEQSGLPYLLVPTENAAEAREVVEERNLSIEIVPVAHIDEAFAFVEAVNGR